MKSKEHSQRLWYSEPAQNWNEALPIGNGRLGAMIFGGVAEEKLQLNEDSVWYGGPRDRNNEDALPHLPKLRQLILEGKLREAEELAAMTMVGLPEAQRHYLPLGDLLLSFGGHEQPAQDYQRELNLESGVSQVSYSTGGVRYTRELFASFPDQAIVLRITADRKNAISLKARFNRQNWRMLEKTEKWNDSGLVMGGECGGRGAAPSLPYSRPSQKTEPAVTSANMCWWRVRARLRCCLPQELRSAILIRHCMPSGSLKS